MGAHRDYDCTKSPFYWATTLAEAAYQLETDDELMLFGKVREPGTAIEAVLTCAVYDAAKLAYPRQGIWRTAPMATVLLRTQIRMPESEQWLTRYLREHPGESDTLEYSYQQAAETMTAYGEEHVFDFEERVEKAEDIISEAFSLFLDDYMVRRGIKKRPSPAVEYEGIGL